MKRNEGQLKTYAASYRNGQQISFCDGCAIKIRIIQNADVKNREVLKSSRIKGSIFHLSTLGI